MQPYFVPYIGYFQLIKAVDKFVILDDVNYINKGWINRNNFLINGKASLITIPLKEASQNRLIRDIHVSDDSRWRHKILKTVEMNYKKAPYFQMTFSFLVSAFQCSDEDISKWNLKLLRSICAYLDIKTDFVETSSLFENANLKGQERIVDICVKQGATRYINPIGGVNLYSRDVFMEKGVDLSFIRTRFIEYKQFRAEFVPGLSIIDAMMFNSPENLRNMLDKYELV